MQKQHLRVIEYFNIAPNRIMIDFLRAIQVQDYNWKFTKKLFNIIANFDKFYAFKDQSID